MSQANEERLLFELKSRGPQPAAALAAALVITPMGAHKLLARLEEQGLVRARRKAGSRRGTPGASAAMPMATGSRRAWGGRASCGR